MGSGDVRITTRFAGLFTIALRSTTHESGHALYELGLTQTDRTPLGTEPLAIHECSPACTKI
jgi:Zn-dependent M32 family carboxypeptidase